MKCWKEIFQACGRRMRKVRPCFDEWCLPAQTPSLWTCIPVLQWLPIPGTPEGMCHTLPLEPKFRPRVVRWPEVPPGGRAQGYFTQDIRQAHACFDPTSSWNFYQLNRSGTRSGSCICSFLYQNYSKITHSYRSEEVGRCLNLKILFKSQTVYLVLNSYSSWKLYVLLKTIIPKYS